MDANTAEALRRAARPNLGVQKLVGENAQDARPYEFCGIRMFVFHSDKSQPNPIEIWNIEGEPEKHITIPAMMDGLIKGNYSVDLDAILRVTDGPPEEYIYQQLERFLYRINRHSHI